MLSSSRWKPLSSTISDNYIGTLSDAAQTRAAGSIPLHHSFDRPLRLPPPPSPPYQSPTKVPARPPTRRVFLFHFQLRVLSTTSFPQHYHVVPSPLPTPHPYRRPPTRRNPNIPTPNTSSTGTLTSAAPHPSPPPLSLSFTPPQAPASQGLSSATHTAVPLGVLSFRSFPTSGTPCSAPSTSR